MTRENNEPAEPGTGGGGRGRGIGGKGRGVVGRGRGLGGRGRGLGRRDEIGEGGKRRQGRAH